MTTSSSQGAIHIIAEPLEAAVTVAIADRAVAAATADAVSAALHATFASFELREPRVLHVRTRKRFASLGQDAVRGTIMIVRITETNARHLVELVEAARGAGAAGIQIVWDGITPTRERVERHVFAVLERARATPGGPPVVLAKEPEPALALRILAEQRSKRADGDKEGGQ